MALNRRAFLGAIPLYAALAAACSGPLNSVANTGLVELASTPAKGSDKTILVFMPKTPQTDEVWKGLTDELSEDYQLIAVQVDSGPGAASALGQGIDRYKPVALVLMNNPTVNAYHEYQQRHPNRKFPPAVVVMASFLDGLTAKLVSTTGVSYEVPLITAMTNFRRLIALKSERVGVVVRSPLRTFVDRQVSLARREQVVVTQELVGPDPNPSEIKRAIRRLKKTSDILWILNDDRLLTPKLISEGWLPGLDERPWVPTIVGAGSLVSPSRSFGTFAVLPDHVALGGQAANLLLDIADEGWTLEPNRFVQLPLSTTTTMDLNQVKERFAMQKDALHQVDHILE